MMRLLFVAISIMISVSAWSQASADPKCISIMGAPLEGPDSVFIPALDSVGLKQVYPEDPEADTYYFEGDFYGIKSSMTVTVNEKTKLLEEATITCGPYRTRDLYDRNQKYLIGRLQREWGNFKAKGDGSLYMLNDYGYIRQSTGLDEEGRHAIRYYYLNSSPYYKDAANMGLKGFVQEVITSNPVFENDMEHFSETGQVANDELTDREYDSRGYLIRAAMIEQSGGKSRLTYEYDSDYNLKRRTLVNAATGIRSVNEYKYNGDNEITQQTQKVFNDKNECVMSITMKNSFEEHDDNGNWTKNTLSLTYWEKDQRAQMATVHQTRTISYWDED